MSSGYNLPDASFACEYTGTKNKKRLTNDDEELLSLRQRVCKRAAFYVSLGYMPGYSGLDIRQKAFKQAWKDVKEGEDFNFHIGAGLMEESARLRNEKEAFEFNLGKFPAL